MKTEYMERIRKEVLFKINLRKEQEITTTNKNANRKIETIL